MDKFLFLDFDGVITTQKSRYALDQDKCQLIQRIINETSAKIIVTSTWRRSHSVDSFKKKLSSINEHRVPFMVSWIDDIIGLTPELDYMIKPIGLFHIPRGIEIEFWLDKQNISSSYQYVILDDDVDMLLYQKDHFVKTDTQTGISEADALKVIEILNSNIK